MTADRLLESAPLPVTAEDAAAVLEQTYGLSGNVEPMPGDRDRNFRVDSDGETFMLKIANPAEDLDVVLAQQEVLLHVSRWDEGLPVPAPIPTRNGELATTAEVLGAAVPIRMTSFVSGATVDQVGWNGQLHLDMAGVLARLARRLADRPARHTQAPHSSSPRRAEAARR